MTIFYISDTHFSHANMCTLFKLADGTPARKFASVEEMDEIMISRWNEVVRPGDHVWHLGDVTFIRPRMDSILPRLLGQKRLVLGNHDKFQVSAYAKHFTKIRGSCNHDKMLFTHFPVAPWSFGKFAANVHGHVHQSLPLVYRAIDPLYRVDAYRVEASIPKVYVNISVEQTGYRPISLEEVKKLVEKAR